MRSVSSPRLCLSNQRLRATVKPKNRSRKAHLAGQTRVPAATNRARAKTTNIPTICTVSSLRLIFIGQLLHRRTSENAHDRRLGSDVFSTVSCVLLRLPSANAKVNIQLKYVI